MKLRIKYVLILFTCFFISGILFSQKENKQTQKGLEIVLDSLSKNNPNEKYYFVDSDVNHLLKGSIYSPMDCSINTDKYKQNDDERLKIKILDSLKKHFRKNTILNKIRYGKRLKSIKVYKPFYSDENNYIFYCKVSGNEGGENFILLINSNTLTLENYCNYSTIY